MTPLELRECVDALNWSLRGLATLLDCDYRMVRRWETGQVSIPPKIADWLRVMADLHRQNPPPVDWRRNGLVKAA